MYCSLVVHGHAVYSPKLSLRPFSVGPAGKILAFCALRTVSGCGVLSPRTSVA